MDDQTHSTASDTLVMIYRGVLVPADLRPNWFDKRVEVAWWRRGVDAALYAQEQKQND